MVARTPRKLHHKMVAPLSPTLLRETVNKVDKCMARLQELQFTVAGGRKVISGVTLSPTSTRHYLRTSLRCKQETARIRSITSHKSSPRRSPTTTGEWQRMSLPAMLLGETVGEILQANQFTRQIMVAIAPNKKTLPKTPVTIRRIQRQNLENPELRAPRNREKQTTIQSMHSGPDAPRLQRARTRINFKVSPPKKRENDKENCGYATNRVSPRNKPWAKKAVLFPNPLSHTSSPTKTHHKFCKRKSPVIATNRQTTPHKFLVKSPATTTSSKFQVKIRSPPVSLSPTRPSSSLIKKSPKMSTAAKLRRSFSPSRLANRLVSPLKSRKSMQKNDEMKMMTGGLEQRRPNAYANAVNSKILKGHQNIIL